MAPHSSILAMENPMEGGAWKAAVHGVTEGWTRLTDFTFTFHFHVLEKEMAWLCRPMSYCVLGPLPAKGKDISSQFLKFRNEYYGIAT